MKTYLSGRSRANIFKCEFITHLSHLSYKTSPPEEFTINWIEKYSTPRISLEKSERKKSIERYFRWLTKETTYQNSQENCESMEQI